MHHIILAVILLVLTATPAAAQLAGDPAPPPASPDFYPAQYIGQGDAFNCSDFVSQADAQAVLRADPIDPNELDRDRDGIACETRPLPRDLMPVAR